VHIVVYQQKMPKYFNVKVKLRSFNIGDLVLRKVNTRNLADSKLGRN